MPLSTSDSLISKLSTFAIILFFSAIFLKSSLNSQLTTFFDTLAKLTASHPLPVPATELKNKEVKTENSDKEKPKVKRKYTKKSDKKTTTTKATKKKRQKEKKGTK